MLFYIQKFYYNNMGKVVCFTSKSSFLSFHCNSDIFSESKVLFSSCLSWKSNAFSSCYFIMNDSCGCASKN